MECVSRIAVHQTMDLEAANNGPQHTLMAQLRLPTKQRCGLARPRVRGGSTFPLACGASSAYKVPGNLPHLCNRPAPLILTKYTELKTGSLRQFQAAHLTTRKPSIPVSGVKCNRCKILKTTHYFITWDNIMAEPSRF